MKAREFCYWLQGMFELSPPLSGLSGEQADKIKNHLDMVFIHDIDPSYPEGPELDAAHHSNLNNYPFKPGDPPMIMRC